MNSPRQVRYDQLDSLRGIAAVTVLFSHFTLLAPLAFLRKTPFRLLCGGHEAVLLFFLLSGFVLTLQLSKKNHIAYSLYVVRRVCRIYLPYLTALGIAVVIFSVCFSGEVKWAGSWFNHAWRATLSVNDISHHLLFLGPFPTDRIVPVIWSLVYEMRISLMFPLVVAFLVRAPSALTLSISLLMSGAVLAVFVITGSDPMAASINGDLLMTLHYLLMFIVGGLLAKHRYALVRNFDTRRRNIALLFASLILYFLARPMTMRVDGALNGFLFDWLVVLGAAGLITSAITFAPLVRLLKARPLLYLGHISFSVYLFHTIVLLGVTHYFTTSPLFAIALAFVLVLPVSALAYRFIEKPTIRIGAALTRPEASIGKTTEIA